MDLPFGESRPAACTLLSHPQCCTVADLEDPSISQEENAIVSRPNNLLLDTPLVEHET